MSGSGRKKYGRYVTVYEEVEVEICLDDFTDEAIREEAEERGILACAGTSAASEAKFDPRTDASDIAQDFMCRRVDRGTEALKDLIGKFVPPQLIAALEFARDGNFSAAVCELDRYVDPSPAATATTLPAKPLHA